MIIPNILCKFSDKNVIGQTYDNTYVTYITPWTNYMSDDGLITPNAGWWAFDVDLSQTRNDGFYATDNIRLQMRSWNVQHVSLNSTMAAALKGSYVGNLDADVNLLKSQHVGNSARGVVVKLTDMSGNLESTCSSKTSIQENDDMRRAYGLNSYKTNFDQTIVDAHPTGYYTDFDMVYKIDGRNQYENTALHDFLYASKDKMGFENSRSPYPMLGRKYNDFWLEPVYISNENRVASHEVNVIVQVKLKSIDAPIVYVRNYLPEYKVYDYGEFQNSVKRFTEKYRHSDMYDYQMQRIADICSIYSLKYNKPYTATEGNYANAGASNLFNSDFNDPWYVKTSDKQNGIWYVEFYRNDRAITPVSYVLSVRGNNTSTKNRNPKSWKLKAKLNEGDQWVTISEKNNASILVDCVNYASKTFDLSVTGRQWKYFRLEVSENWGDDVMQIGEFNFNE